MMNTNKIKQKGVDERQQNTIRGQWQTPIECGKGVPTNTNIIRQASTKECQQAPTRHRNGTLAKKQQNNRNTNKTQIGSIDEEQ